MSRTAPWRLCRVKSSHHILIERQCLTFQRSPSANDCPGVEPARGVPVEPGVAQSDNTFDSLMSMLRPRPTGKPLLLISSWHSMHTSGFAGHPIRPCKEIGNLRSEPAECIAGLAKLIAGLAQKYIHSRLFDSSPAQLKSQSFPAQNPKGGQKWRQVFRLSLLWVPHRQKPRAPWLRRQRMSSRKRTTCRRPFR